MLSAARTGAAQWGQRDPGRTIDSPRGTRTMATLKKLPQTAPNSPAITTPRGEDDRKARLSPMPLDAKVPGALRGNYVAALAVSLVALGAGACGRHRGKPETSPVVAPAEAFRPAFLAEALRKLGGAHYHATLRYGVGRAGSAPLTITTTTDVWLDRTGNYRLREENDRDGGREVILTGRELAVALRYGKMIRRVAEEPEPSRMLEEGLGAPWAAFELCAPRMHVEKTGDELVGGARATSYTLTLGDGAAVAQGAGPRASVDAGCGPGAARRPIETLSGRAIIDDATGALLAVNLTATFQARGDAGPEHGAVEVHASLAEVGVDAGNRTAGGRRAVVAAAHRAGGACAAAWAGGAGTPRGRRAAGATTMSEPRQDSGPGTPELVVVSPRRARAAAPAPGREPQADRAPLAAGHRRRRGHPASRSSTTTSPGGFAPGC